MWRMFLNVSQLTIRYTGAAHPSVNHVSLDLRAGDIFLGLDLQPQRLGQRSEALDDFRFFHDSIVVELSKTSKKPGLTTTRSASVQAWQVANARLAATASFRGYVAVIR